MITFILILLVVAAVFGVLGAVLKVALILVLSFVLATTVLLWAGWWWFRSRMQAFQRDLELEQRRRRVVDTRPVRNEADDDRPELGAGPPS